MWDELSCYFGGDVTRIFIPKYHAKINKETTKKSE
jgi:hypothetical protein